ncbi:MAG: GrpB family protein [Chloroflexota bacterium]
MTLEPHDPRSVEVAARVRELVRQELPEVQVEHVGSTAVPGCEGKGVVDLVAGYPDGRLQAVKEALSRLGFQRQRGGHAFPEDRPMRTGSLEQGGALFQIHLHVIDRGSDEFVRLVEFRDRLRADPALAASYVARKRELIESGLTDGKEYSEAKGPFVAQALVKSPEDHRGGHSPQE